MSEPRPERAEADQPQGDRCPRCGLRVAPDQEYCLECGLRLPFARGVVPALGRAWRRRLPWYPGDWIWPALLLVLVAAAGAAAAIATSDRSTSAARPTLVATTATTRPVATRPSTPLPTSTVTATRTAPPPPGTTTAASAPTTTRRVGAAPIAWPAGKTGYTVVVASLPSAGGLAPAQAKAREAARAGLPDVGVLDSARFSSLHPGYYVVFSGVYDRFEEAQRAAGLASDRYRAAYARQIVP